MLTKREYEQQVPGRDYTLTGIPERKTRERLKTDAELVQCDCSLTYGLTYQKCRFCGRGWPELPYLLKYAVRHYICAPCREHYRRLP